MNISRLIIGCVVSLAFLTGPFDRAEADLVPVLFKDINPGPGHSHPGPFSQIGPTWFFPADDGVHGQELWKTDGTLPGTVMVKDINTGPEGAVLYRMWAVGEWLYFEADDGVHGRELWKTDGTEAGTVLVADIEPGPTGSWPEELVAAAGTLFFTAYRQNLGRELWKTDGTASGTVRITDLPSGPNMAHPADLTEYRGLLYFRANDVHAGDELWKSDGTGAGTRRIGDIYPGPSSALPQFFTVLNDELLFSASDPDHRFELWKTDGTYGGTELVKDIFPGVYSSEPYGLVEMGGAVYFSAVTEAHGRELWKSDGTTSGTVMVKELLPGIGGSFPTLNNYLPVNGTLFLQVRQAYLGFKPDALWKSDGTEAGTVMIKDIQPLIKVTEPWRLAEFGGKVYMSAADSIHGFEVWESDGTSAGTRLVADVVSGAGHFHPRHFNVIGGNLFFSGDDGAHGQELWWLQDPTVPVAVQTYQSIWTGTHVELVWKLIDVTSPPTFEISRAESPAGPSVRLHRGSIASDGDGFSFVDETAKPGRAYAYSVAVYDDNGFVTSFQTEIKTPAAQIALHQNRPNPFNPNTTISFTLPEPGDATLSIYAPNGELVRTLVSGALDSGRQHYEWDGTDERGNPVSSGVYFYKLSAGKRTLTKKMILLK